MTVQPHQLDVDELSALAKNRQSLSKSAASQLDDVNQRWNVMLQQIIDTKVRLNVILLWSLHLSLTRHKM